MCATCGCAISNKKDPRYGKGAPKDKKASAKKKKKK